MARSKKVQLFPKSLLGTSLTTDISAKLAALERGVMEKVIRPAAYAGAVELYDEMRRRVPVGETGNLYNSIYHWFNTKTSNDFRKTYGIGPNVRKAPHWYNVEYGHWRYNKFANGRWQRSKSNRSLRGPGAHDLPGALPQPIWVPSKPYLRITFTAKSADAARAMNIRAAQRVAELMNELARA